METLTFLEIAFSYLITATPLISDKEHSDLTLFKIRRILASLRPWGISWLCSLLFQEARKEWHYFDIRCFDCVCRHAIFFEEIHFST
jgi:hypothetical protein